jgi:putative ABC transport system permease protein
MTVLRTQLHGLARRPARLLLTGLAMLVASFVVYGTVLAQYSTARTVVDGLSGTPEAADVVAGDWDRPVSTGEMARIRAVPGVAEAAGRASVGFELRAPAGTYLAVIADPGTGPLATVRLVDGAYPDAPNEIAVSRRTADWFGLTIGGAAAVIADGGKQANLTVTGVVDDGRGGAGSAYTTDGCSARSGRRRSSARSTSASSRAPRSTRSGTRSGRRYRSAPACRCASRRPPTPPPASS